jgi:Domain of unknown function (DUF1996)
MKNGRLYWVAILVFAVTGCGGDEGETTVAGNSAFTLLSPPSPTPAAPTAVAVPSPVTNTPFIDNAKIPTAVVGFSDARIRNEPNGNPKQNTDGTGQFRFTCEFSHMNYDDPIVYPGKQGAAHLHAFFGNTAINYASTQESIEKTGNSTCAGGIVNRTGYWIPAIIDTKDGTPLKPYEIMVYYKASTLGNVKPYPAGLRMIAGDMKATAPQALRVDWACLTPSGSGSYIKNIPAICPAGDMIEASIEFPNCWDGINLDSPDHKAHMSYITWNNDLRKNECPKTHPVELPMLTEKVKYLVTETGSTARWRLSSDNYGTDKPGGYSLHADWFNGWDPKVQEIWIKNCLQAKRDCHGFLLGDGTALF